MNPYNGYLRALRRAERSVALELAHLRAARSEVLAGTPDGIERAVTRATDLARRVERRGLVIHGRARRLAALSRASSAELSAILQQLPPPLAAQVRPAGEALRERGLELRQERIRFRRALSTGRAVIVGLLGELQEVQDPRSRTRGLRRPQSAALDRSA